MIKINISKKELEDFIDSLKNDFEKLRSKENLTLWFNKFKEYFCDDNLNLDNKLKNKEVKLLKIIYSKISSDNSKFYRQIREFIIKKITEKIKFCPYCWKVPLIYFEKWKDKKNSYQRLFQLDHFFPKNYYHKWIINFYNLIPSCNACNHLKLDDNPINVINSWWVVFHPYFWNLYLEDWKIKKDYEENYEFKNYDIWLCYKSQNLNFFKFWQKYLNSQDTFNIFNFIQDKRTKIKNELNNFKVDIKDLTEEEKKYKIEKYKDYFFKNYYPKKEQDILKFSNWKLKKDLIENLKL